MGHFLFVVGHFIQGILEIAMMPICPQEAWSCLKTLLKKKKRNELFGAEFVTLLKRSSIRLPFFICNACIFVLGYKYKRKQLLIQEFYGKYESMKDS